MTRNAVLVAWERRAQWPLSTMALVFLSAYSIDVLVQPQGTALRVLDLVTMICWAAFLIDYGVRLSLATDRRDWFVRHLVDLAIVVLPLLRPLRVLRAIVLVTALQSAVGNAIRGRVLLFAFASSLLLTYVASLAVLNAERSQPDATITTFGRAIWWAVTTITTVGYGDEFPITTTGKMIAGLLMFGGVSLVGTITAIIASWIVQRVAEEDSLSQAITVAHIEELRDEIAGLRKHVQERSG